jgi:pilus assembly protein CpaF
VNDRTDEHVLRWLAEDRALSSAELTERLRSLTPAASASSTSGVVNGALRRIDGYGPLAPLLASPDITDICINGPGPVRVDAHGVWHDTGIVVDDEGLQLVIERLLAHSDKRIDRLHPLVDARMPDGSRIHVVAPPVSTRGPLVTIRCFRPGGVPLVEFGDEATVARLRTALADRCSIVVSGSTGAGKTSLVGALLDELDPAERLVVVEDTAELRLNSASAVRLEAQPVGPEGTGEVTLRTLVRNALRMRPDRLVVGEVRGPEALDLLLALNTGHRGCLATCHGADPLAVLHRLEVLALLADASVDRSAVRPLVEGGIDLVVHVERRGSARRVVDVHSVGGKS